MSEMMSERVLKECWICYQNERECSGEGSGDQWRWVHPCTCRGGLKWCHERCLLGWIDEKQKGNSAKPVRCPQCLTNYTIIFPKTGLFLNLGESIDRTISATFPYVALSGVLYCGYISCITYGFYAVVQMMGAEESERLLQESPRWGWRLLVGLPMIPVSLISSRFGAFDALLPFVPVLILPSTSLRLTWPPSPAVIISLLPWGRIVYGVAHRALCRWLEGRIAPGAVSGTNPQANQNNNQNNNPNQPSDDQHVGGEEGAGGAAGGNQGTTVSLDSRGLRHPLRMVVGALLLPAISSLVGSALFGSLIQNTFHRNIVGGIFFVVAQDVLSLLYYYRRHKMQSQRHIQDYSEASQTPSPRFF